MGIFGNIVSFALNIYRQRGQIWILYEHQLSRMHHIR